jgi:hypothetical protein
LARCADRIFEMKDGHISQIEHWTDDTTTKVTCSR